MTGRCKRIARRVGGDTSRPPQVTRPRETGISPIAASSRVVFPEPFGPISMVGAPSPIDREMSSRIVTFPARIPAAANMIGKSETGARIVILPNARRRGARPRPAR
jgi:hypothetical protein